MSVRVHTCPLGWNGCAPEARTIEDEVSFLKKGDFFIVLEEEADIKVYPLKDEPIILNLTRAMVKKVYYVNKSTVYENSRKAM